MPSARATSWTFSNRWSDGSRRRSASTRSGASASCALATSVSRSAGQTSLPRAAAIAERRSTSPVEVPGAVAGWRVAETVMVLGMVDLPLDLGLSPSGARRFQALAGPGTEIYLAQGVTLLVAGQLGVESFKQPREDAITRLGYQVKLGIGARLF